MLHHHLIDDAAEPSRSVVEVALIDGGRVGLA
jgi:hypothetical protein